MKRYQVLTINARNVNSAVQKNEMVSWRILLDLLLDDFFKQVIGISCSKKLVTLSTMFSAWEKGWKHFWNRKTLGEAQLIQFMFIQFNEDILQRAIRWLQSVFSTCKGRLISFTQVLIIGPGRGKLVVTNITKQRGLRRGFRRGTITDPFDMPFEALSLSKGKNLKTFWTFSLFLDVFELRESQLKRKQEISLNLYHKYWTLTCKSLTKRTLFKGMLFSSR